MKKIILAITATILTASFANAQVLDKASSTVNKGTSAKSNATSKATAVKDAPANQAAAAKSKGSSATNTVTSAPNNAASSAKSKATGTIK